MLFNSIKTSFKELITNRYLTVLSAIVLLLAISLLVYILVVVHPRDIQQVVHATTFGVTRLYVNQWYYLYSFALFGLLVAVIHIALAIKLYISKGHPLALFFAWLGFGIIVFAWIDAFQVVNILSSV
jgi:hypothetical protein